MNDRAPPPARPLANVRAEEAVIGKIIGSADAYWEIAGMLKAEHFTVPHHREIFAAVAKCCEGGSGPTMSLLEAHLPISWEGVGDVEPTLQILVERASDVGSATDFVEGVLGAWRERERVAIGKIANQPGRSFEDIREAIEMRFAQVDDADRQHHTVTVGEVAGMALQRSAEAYENRGKRQVGIYTGIPEFDEVVGPMIPGTLVTLGAPSGHGKSAWLSQVFRNNAALNLDASRMNACGFLSMEMSEIQNGYRNLASMTGISIGKQIVGSFNEVEFEELRRAKGALEQMPIHIQARGRLTARQAGDEARKMVRRHGIKLLGIDHLRLYEPERPSWTEVQTIEHATAYNKALAKELDIVIIQLAQLTQESQKTSGWRFKSSSFYGGGMVKANSDIMLGIAVPVEYLRENQPEQPSSEEGNKIVRDTFDAWIKNMEIWKDRAEFVALKVRDGATSQWKTIDFDGPRLLFGNRDRVDIPF